jgi:hypothetical protein
VSAVASVPPLTGIDGVASFGVALGLGRPVAVCVSGDGDGAGGADRQPARIATRTRGTLARRIVGMMGETGPLF